MHMEFVFFLIIIIWHCSQHCFFPSLHISCYTSVPPLVGGKCLLGKQAGFVTSSPILASWRTSSLGAFVCGNQLMFHAICESPLEGFYERLHTPACLSLTTQGWSPHPSASPGLALWFLTLRGKCLCFNRRSFQLSPCTLKVSLSHPEQISLFFSLLFVLLNLLLNNRFFPHCHVSALIKDRFSWK